MTAPLARLVEDQPRIDGSIHDEHHCYECGASTRDVPMDPIIRYNLDTHETEYRFACSDIGPCSLRTVKA